MSLRTGVDGGKSGGGINEDGNSKKDMDAFLDTIPLATHTQRGRSIISMFVEDCVREMAKRVVETFTTLPDDSIISVKQVNEESIHQHDAIAERVASIGELRVELKANELVPGM